MSNEIHLWPIEKTITAKEDESVLAACKRQGIEIKSSCGGVASCADCICRIVSGEDFLSPMEFSEIKLLGNVFHITKERLLCQLKVSGRVSIDISDHINHTKEEEIVRPSKIVIRKKTDLEAQRLEQKEKEAQALLELSTKEENDKPKKLGGSRRPKGFKFSE